MQGFQQYQAAFTAHLRQPATAGKPAGVAEQRMAIYRQIVFNNFMTSVSACFPVLQQILGKRQFKKLVRLCFAQHHFSSPLFRDIPLAFVHYLQSLDLAALTLPPFTAQLAHYEWAELYVSNLSDLSDLSGVAQTDLLPDGTSLLSCPLRMNPAHALLAYDYPVHLLSKKYAPTQATPTYLCLVSGRQQKVSFIQLNQTTYLLLQLLQAQPHTAQSALQAMAEQLQHPHPASLMSHGLQTIEALLAQEVLLTGNA